MKKNFIKSKGFTLVEVMVVVFIVALLASLTAVSFKSIRVKSRDTKRVDTLNTLNQALQAYYNDEGIYPATLTFGQPLKNILGTKVYLDEVPKNPTPRTDHGCVDSEYIYTVTPDKKSYSLSGCVGADNNPNSIKLIFSTKEGIFHCGDTITDRDNFTYKTVSIGTQCWMAENLKTKTRADGTCLNEGPSVEAAPGCLTTVAGIKYGGFINSARDCIDTVSNTRGDENDCIAIGALYNWKGAMSFRDVQFCATTLCATPLVEPFQGMCPDGWHIPTDNEFTTLERAVCTSSTCLTDFPYTSLFPPSTPLMRGTNEGLKLGQYVGSILNGFTYGRRNDNSPFDTFQGRVGTQYGYLNTATETSANTFARRFMDAGDIVMSRDSGAKARSTFVRCVKN